MPTGAGMRTDRHDPPTLASIYGTDPTLPARCGCGRDATLDKLHDVTTFPAGVYPVGEIAVCDACFILPLYQGRVSHAAMVHFTGGPPAAVARARAKQEAEVAAGNIHHQPDVLDAPRDGAGGGAITPVGTVRGA